MTSNTATCVGKNWECLWFYSDVVVQWKKMNVKADGEEEKKNKQKV